MKGDDEDIKDQFNKLRKMCEDVFKAFSKHNLLPVEFVKPNLALNETNKFLTGKKKDGQYFIEKGYKHHDETHLPDLVANYLRNILYVTQSGSHRSTVDEHVRILNTPFLFQSVLFQLLDVIIWFKIYLDSKPKTGNWSRIETHVETNIQQLQNKVLGQIVRIDSQKRYGFFKPDESGDDSFIPPRLVEHHDLKVSMKILAEIEEYEKEGKQMTRVKSLEIL